MTTHERFSASRRSHCRLAPVDRRALARLRFISCLSFPKLKFGVGLVWQRGRASSGRHQSLAGQSPGRSAAGLDLFGRLPAMGWRRCRLCRDPAKSGPPTTALSSYRHHGFGCIQPANCIGIGDALSVFMSPLLAHSGHLAAPHMSAIGCKADMGSCTAHVRFGPKAGIGRTRRIRASALSNSLRAPPFNFRARRPNAIVPLGICRLSLRGNDHD